MILRACVIQTSMQEKKALMEIEQLRRNGKKAVQIISLGVYIS